METGAAVTAPTSTSAIRAAQRRTPNVFRVPIYPSAIAVTFVLDLWLHSTLDPPTLVRPVLVALLIAVGITVLAVLLTRSVDEGGVVAALAIVGLAGGDDPRVIVLALVAIVGFVLVAWRARSFERRVPWARITAALNVFAVAFLALTGLQAVQAQVATKPFAMEPISIASPSVTLPNVVVLLLDEHGRQDILDSGFGEDISAFTDGLEDRGFHVSQKSRSNYMSTQLTLTSMFNMKHLPELDLPTGSELEFATVVRSRLADNRGFDALRAAGYRIGAVPSGFDGQTLRTADEVPDGGQLNELENAAIANSSLARVIGALSPDAAGDQYRKRVLWNLDPANWLPELSGSTHLAPPYFMFVHVPSPHPPFVFDRTGNPLPYAPLVVAEGRAMPAGGASAAVDHGPAYAAQLAYVDGLALDTVDRVIAATPPSTVIIVMSDHGPGAHVDWGHLTAANSTERFATLFAARTPGRDALFGEAPTPVNLLPTLLNAYAGADLPMQPDDSYLGVLPFTPLENIGNPDAVAR